MLIERLTINLFNRFGPLVWRSSKERRKTKTHRRDKCNSGDSGIQVELENDENIHTDCMVRSSENNYYYLETHVFIIFYRIFIQQTLK